ncbi:centromere protein X [Anomaloglossus baeobatrachus]|uniref:centromere protein X n=1 Tax=Anomaloglossus baeobatrachus TaxID=238106 RepID=UPI003F5094BF
MEREVKPADFRKSVVTKLLQMHLEEEKTRFSGDSIQLMRELLRVFVHEAASRAARQALAEDLPVVDIEHVEKILPRLLLDF